MRKSRVATLVRRAKRAYFNAMLEIMLYASTAGNS